MAPAIDGPRRLTFCEPSRNEDVVRVSCGSSLEATALRMPAASVFFDDPDRNFLEYIAMLDDEPQPELGLLLSWSEWQAGRKKTR